ncbi:unnamed protein product [Bursaphelenchus okinawaensis]|uniref:Uncharacterized protein n=1 Tax=Bursaphelenchus okinawaensis TaxID=465554 RepID=A0A811L4A1_9BILA|nr:unnamed protein product [Bursaphelenchus okinawaensis]CAG9117016.1 unnamed protein product [Bursaphelenchus okinawaensis]
MIEEVKVQFLVAPGQSCEITLLRPVNVLPLDTKSLPMDQRQEGFSYMLAVLYQIEGRPLKLHVGAWGNKVYVLTRKGPHHALDW